MWRKHAVLPGNIHTCITRQHDAEQSSVLSEKVMFCLKLSYEFIWHLFFSAFDRQGCLFSCRKLQRVIFSLLLCLQNPIQPFDINLQCLSSFGVFRFRWTPLMVARSWHRNWLEEILNPTTEQPQSHPSNVPSPFLCLPLMSIVKIAQYEIPYT